MVGHKGENGDIELSRRYLRENNKGRTAGQLFGSGFVTSIGALAKEIFFGAFGRAAHAHGSPSA
jgi:hypothetical protein